MDNYWWCRYAVRSLLEVFNLSEDNLILLKPRSDICHRYLFRAGHATILLRQRDHVFRPHSCLVLQYCCICCAPSRHWDLNIFQIFSGPWDSIMLSRCRCHEAKTLSRAQLWANLIALLIKKNKFVYRKKCSSLALEFRISLELRYFKNPPFPSRHCFRLLHANTSSYRSLCLNLLGKKCCALLWRYGLFNSFLNAQILKGQ